MAAPGLLFMNFTYGKSRNTELKSIQQKSARAAFVETSEDWCININWFEIMILRRENHLEAQADVKFLKEFILSCRLKTAAYFAVYSSKG